MNNMYEKIVIENSEFFEDGIDSSKSYLRVHSSTADVGGKDIPFTISVKPMLHRVNEKVVFCGVKVRIKAQEDVTLDESFTIYKKFNAEGWNKVSKERASTLMGFFVNASLFDIDVVKELNLGKSCINDLKSLLSIPVDDTMKSTLLLSGLFKCIEPSVFIPESKYGEVVEELNKQIESNQKLIDKLQNKQKKKAELIASKTNIVNNVFDATKLFMKELESNTDSDKE